MLAIVRDVIFPIMRYTEADEELWDADPIEYIRTKFGMILITNWSWTSIPNCFIFLHHLIPDIYDDYATPVPAAQGLFHSSCKKRKGILQEAMLFLKTVKFSNIVLFRLKGNWKI